MKRVYNFNAGPSAMPLEVLKEVQAEFLDFNGTGMSIVEISHRSAAYQAMQDDTVAMLKKLLVVPDDYHIVFIQGGGSMQFTMHAANFLKTRGGYLNTGIWFCSVTKHLVSVEFEKFFRLSHKECMA